MICSSAFGQAFGKERRLLATVSVVVPTYNQGESVTATLDAVRQQTVLPLEIVVVDDGSTDNTERLLRDYQCTEVPLKVIRQSNGGPGKARQRGWQEARGEIIAFTDADAIPYPQWIENALPAFDSPRVAGVEGRVTTLGATPPTIYTHQVRNPFGGQFMTANMFYRRTVIEAVGGFKSAYREDSDLAFSVLEMGGEIPFAAESIVQHPPRQEDLLFLFRKARRRRYEGLLFKTHPDVAGKYLPKFQPTEVLVVLGELLILAGFLALGYGVVSVGLLALLIGLPKRVLAWLDGRRYSYKEYLLAMLIALLLVPVEAFYRWWGLMRPARPLMASRS